MAVGLALAERDARRALQPRRPRVDRPPHLRDRQRRRHPGGRRLRGVARWPATSASASLIALLRRQPHPARGQDRRWPSARTWASATRPTAGTCSTSARTWRSTTLEAAIEAANEVDDRPSLIIAAHAHRLRRAEQAGHQQGPRLAARRGGGAADQGGLRLGPRRAVPRARRGARALPRAAVERGAEAEAEWEARAAAYREAHPELWAELELVMDGRLPEGWDDDVPRFAPDDDPIATRKASGR